MRPRQIAAENDEGERSTGLLDTASMRPRQIAAENHVKNPSRTASQRFNEAAANRRGKLDGRHAVLLAQIGLQ